MVNLEHKLTVDDLIVEYMIYKVKNGYEPSFLTSEFINFLYFFENKMAVEDALYENNKLFERFFERKNESDWSITGGYLTEKKHEEPHMDMYYSRKDNDYIIKANYRLSEYDRSLINTYFMSGGKWGEGETKEIRSIIGEYLSNKPKRKIDETLGISQDELIVGKYSATEIITNIWDSYIKKQIEYQKWPSQCKDINKYLIEMDLSKIIGLKSIRSELFNLYDILSRRIALMYNQDKNLRISSCSGSYLSQANYDLLIQNYEKIMQIAFKKYNKSLSIDLSKLIFRECREMDGIYNWDEDPDVKTTTTAIGNENRKKLVRNLDKLISKK